VDWIDTTLPTVEVSYSPDTLTAENVVVTLRLNRTGTVLGWTATGVVITDT
jgi:hypothetical protein